MEGIEHESFKWNTEFAAEEVEEEGQKYYKEMHKDDYHIQYKMEDPLAYLSSLDPDTMYFYQATR